MRRNGLPRHTWVQPSSTWPIVSNLPVAGRNGSKSCGSSDFEVGRYRFGIEYREGVERDRPDRRRVARGRRERLAGGADRRRRNEFSTRHGHEGSRAAIGC
jgi:hypothetical protein